MVAILFAVLGLGALGAWGVAVVSAIAVIQMAPPGDKLESYFQLGWLRLSTLRARLGPGVEPHLRRYRNALLSFLACILVGMVIGTGLAMERLN